MTSAVVTEDGLTDALNRLVDRVHGAEFAVVLSPDGLPLGGSRQVGAKLAEQISGVVAGLIALGLAATRTCDAGRSASGRGADVASVPVHRHHPERDHPHRADRR